MGGRKPMKTRKAFTLLEAILAMSISTIVMFGCASMLYDMIAVGERLERSWSLKSHADGVERFLQSAVSSSLIMHPTRIQEVLATFPSKTMCLSQPPEMNSASDYYLTFGVNGAHPLFVSPTGFSPAKICWLFHKEDEGLSIIWRHANAEYENSDAGIYKTKISPFVKEIIYIYDDENGWEEETEIDSTDSTKLPYYIKLVFVYGDEKAERVISLSGLVDSQFAR
jgi:hypothetical protein